MQRQLTKRSPITRVAFVMLILTMLLCILLSMTLAKYTATVAGQDKVRVAKFDVTGQAGGPLDGIYDTKLTGTNDGTGSPFGSLDAFLIHQSNPANNWSQLGNVTEVHVDPLKDNGTRVMAPGTWGLVSLDATNNSEVTVDVVFGAVTLESGTQITFTKTELTDMLTAAKAADYNPSLAQNLLDRVAADGSFPATVEIPIQLGYINSGGTVTWTSLSGLGAGFSPGGGTVQLDPGESVSTKTGATAPYIFWKWEFERGSGATLVQNDLIDSIFGFLQASGELTEPYVINYGITITQVD